MRNIIYTSKGTKVQNVYRDKHRLVLRPGVVFPDVCSHSRLQQWSQALWKLAGAALSVIFCVATFVSQPRVNGLALQCQHSERTLMNSTEGFTFHEAL